MRTGPAIINVAQRVTKYPLVSWSLTSTPLRLVRKKWQTTGNTPTDQYQRPVGEATLAAATAKLLIEAGFPQAVEELLDATGAPLTSTQRRDAGLPLA